MAGQPRTIASVYRDAPCVFLDCDGVIFDSNGFKLEALRYALDDQPASALEEMAVYWSANGGVSRYEKLQHFFAGILRTEDVAQKVTAAARRFTEFSRRAYADCAPLAEALAFAQQTGAERCFVVSGTDQDELRDVFTAKDLTPMFAQVCGSPTSKLAHVRRILDERGCAGERALFIGDGGGDFQVAQALSVPFIYIHQYSEWRAAKATMSGLANVYVCETWAQISRQLELSAA